MGNATITRRPARWWLRWPLAAALAWLGVVWEWSDYRSFDLLTLPHGAHVTISGGSLAIWGRNGFLLSTRPTVAGSGPGWTYWKYPNSQAWGLMITLLAFALPLSLATAWAWWPRRTPPGRCPKCGYDRAGLEAGAVCPECGAAEKSSP